MTSSGEERNPVDIAAAPITNHDCSVSRRVGIIMSTSCRFSFNDVVVLLVADAMRVVPEKATEDAMVAREIMVVMRFMMEMGLKMMML